MDQLVQLLLSADIMNVCKFHVCIASANNVIGWNTFLQLSNPLQTIFFPLCAPSPAVCFHSNTICLEARCQVSKLSTELNKEAFSSSSFSTAE